MEQKLARELSVRGASAGLEIAGLFPFLQNTNSEDSILSRSGLKKVLLKGPINHMASGLHMKYALLSHLERKLLHHY